jgi:hypothetical protein
MREPAAVSLRRRQLRTLRGIERELADSDPDLEAYFWSFSVLARTRRMPRREQDSRWPFRQVRDWCAENWTDP